MRFNKAVYLLLIPLIAVGFSCAEKRTDTPLREGQASGPERAIDKPLKAERLTDADIAAAENTAANTGLLDSPVLPFDTDIPCAYKFTRDAIALAMCNFKFTAVGDEGYLADIQWALTPDAKQWGNQSMTKYSFGPDLRPKLYARSIIDKVDKSYSMVQSKDFTVDDPYGIEQRGRGMDEFKLVEIQRPQDDAWPYTSNELAEMALILACVDPGAELASVWTVDFDRAALARMTLTLRGEEPYILNEQPATMSVKKYECAIDGMAVGTFFVDENGRLIAADLPGGVHAELMVNVAP